jgi:hypothetical protein
MVATVGRNRRQTAQVVNCKLREEAETRVAYYAEHPEEIDGRLRELDEEWDVERAIEMEAAATVLAGVFLGATLSKKWFVVPAFASAMLLLHNLQGGYPWLPVFRRLGIRTAQEIAQERYALKAIRGDFAHLSPSDGHQRTREALQAAQPSRRTAY